jgi:hypothetical protein
MSLILLIGLFLLENDIRLQYEYIVAEISYSEISFSHNEIIYPDRPYVNSQSLLDAVGGKSLLDAMSGKSLLDAMGGKSLLYAVSGKICLGGIKAALGMALHSKLLDMSEMGKLDGKRDIRDGGDHARDIDVALADVETGFTRGVKHKVVFDIVKDHIAVRTRRTVAKMHEIKNPTMHTAVAVFLRSMRNFSEIE